MKEVLLASLRIFAVLWYSYSVDIVLYYNNNNTYVVNIII